VITQGLIYLAAESGNVLNAVGSVIAVIFLYRFLFLCVSFFSNQRAKR
jgi:hypothetical protein